jgi:hypothetical protein
VDLDTADDPAAIAEARQAIRAALREFGPAADGDLPSWATTEFTDALIDQATAWMAADWTARRRLLTPPAGDGDRDPLRALAAVYCDQVALHEWVSILDAIDRDGIDVVLAELDTADTIARNLQEWISTPTWNASQTHLAAHPELRDPATLATLEQWSGANARRHLAILRLVAHLPAGDVFDAALDPTDARDLLFATARLGDGDLVAEAWFAADALAGHPFAGPLAVALHRALTNALTDDSTDDSYTIQQAAADAHGAATEQEKRDTHALLRTLARIRDDRAEPLARIAGAFRAAG